MGICVVGVGGAGNNIVSSLAEDLPENNICFLVDTDPYALISLADGPARIIMKSKHFYQSARSVAKRVVKKLKDNGLQDHDVILCGGVGGSTGGGLMPEIARTLARSGNHVKVLAVKPYPFEVVSRINRGAKAFEKLDKYDIRHDVLDASEELDDEEVRRMSIEGFLDHVDDMAILSIKSDINDKFVSDDMDVNL